MTKGRKQKSLFLWTPGILFTIPVLWLIASLALGAATQEKKPLEPKEMAQLKGRPDNLGGPIAPKITRNLAAIPYPPYPPYEPVAMSYQPGVSGLVVYNNTNGVAIINPRNHTISPIMLNEYDYTIDPETLGPIGGPLGSEGGWRLDLAMTSNGRTAMISNFGDSKVFFINLGSGTPVVSGMAKIDFFAEDIAIDPTDTWALVTNGGYSDRIAVLHIPTRQWVPAGVYPGTSDPCSYRIVIEEGPDPDDPYDDVLGSAQAVAIARDGRTVIVADCYGRAIHVLLFDPATGGLAYQQTVELWKYGTDETAAFTFAYYPVNVAISPDGRTAMVVGPYRSSDINPNPDPDAFYEGSNIAMFTIDRPGHVVRQPDVIMPWRVGGAQSIVFSPDGRKAYMETIYYDDEPTPIPPDVFWQYQEIQELTITSPGHASHTGVVRMPTKRGTGQLFGVDIMAVTTDGNYLYVTNPLNYSGASPVIDVINLRTFTHVKQIGTPQHYPDPERDFPNPPDPPDPGNPNDWIEEVIPVGLAFAPTPPNKRPVAVISVDKAELVLDKNEVATFDGSASYDPEKAPLTYTWSTVSVPTGASSTLAPDGSTAVLTPDPDVEGTYQVGLVVSDGKLDSLMATASVRAKFAPVLPPVGAQLERLENDLIFYKEYVNRLSWTANPDNVSTITAFKIYRKQKGAADSAYALLTSLAATATSYDDRGLAADQLFTYRITSVNSRGRESAPIVVGN